MIGRTLSLCLIALAAACATIPKALPRNQDDPAAADQFIFAEPGTVAIYKHYDGPHALYATPSLYQGRVVMRQQVCFNTRSFGVMVLTPYTANGQSPLLVRQQWPDTTVTPEGKLVVKLPPTVKPGHEVLVRMFCAGGEFGPYDITNVERSPVSLALAMQAPSIPAPNASMGSRQWTGVLRSVSVPDGQGDRAYAALLR